MKIYFATSSAFYKSNPKKFDYIKNTLNKFAPGKVFSLTDGKNTNQYPDTAKLMEEAKKLIHTCDALVAIGTQSSAGLGYDIATAATLKKPILVLHHEDERTEDTPHPLRNSPDLIRHIKYNSSNLEATLQKFLGEVRKKLDVKFIMILPAEIDQYLEWASQEYRLHKSQIVRMVMQEHMAQDMRWKAQKESKLYPV